MLETVAIGAHLGTQYVLRCSTVKPSRDDSLIKTIRTTSLCAVIAAARWRATPRSFVPRLNESV